jgi:hypothetical protein
MNKSRVKGRTLSQNTNAPERLGVYYGANLLFFDIIYEGYQTTTSCTSSPTLNVMMGAKTQERTNALLEPVLDHTFTFDPSSGVCTPAQRDWKVLKTLIINLQWKKVSTYASILGPIERRNVSP